MLKAIPNVNEFLQDRRPDYSIVLKLLERLLLGAWAGQGIKVVGCANRF
jgi:hypothetical protein